MHSERSVCVCGVHAGSAACSPHVTTWLPSSPRSFAPLTPSSSCNLRAAHNPQPTLTPTPLRCYVALSHTVLGECVYHNAFNMFACENQDPPLTAVPDNIPNTTVYLCVSHSMQSTFCFSWSQTCTLASFVHIGHVCVVSHRVRFGSCPLPAHALATSGTLFVHIILCSSECVSLSLSLSLSLSPPDKNIYLIKQSGN